jgi:uncharacterized membrane protein YgaE (UPF0421/DUF939 family)
MLKEIINKFVEKSTFQRTEKARIEKQIECLNKKLNKFHSLSWVKEIVIPIAKALNEKLPDRRYEVLGPFGLSC